MDVQEQNKLDSRGIQEQSYCLACSCGVWKREGNWSYPAQIQDLEQQAFLGLCTYLLWVPLPALLQEMNWLFLPFGFFPLSLLRISTPSSCYLGMTASVPLSQLHLLLQFWNCPMLPNLDSREKNSRALLFFLYEVTSYIALMVMNWLPLIRRTVSFSRVVLGC